MVKIEDKFAKIINLLMDYFKKIEDLPCVSAGPTG